MRFVIFDIFIVIVLIGVYVGVKKAVDGITAKKQARLLEKENRRLEEDNLMWVDEERKRHGEGS